MRGDAKDRLFPVTPAIVDDGPFEPLLRGGKNETAIEAQMVQIGGILNGVKRHRHIEEGELIPFGVWNSQFVEERLHRIILVLVGGVQPAAHRQ